MTVIKLKHNWDGALPYALKRLHDMIRPPVKLSEPANQRLTGR